MGSLRAIWFEITLNRGPENPWHTTYTKHWQSKGYCHWRGEAVI